MSTFEYLTPGEAVAATREDVPDYLSIVGLRGADADWCTRTATRQARKPSDTWSARTYLDRFKEIKLVEYVTGEADPGTVEVFYADGTSAYLHGVDLLCVERPVEGAEVGDAGTAHGAYEYRSGH
ncbi:hypothetical protein [Streptomyces sp. 5-10]|uniref:hypothetical protein n=1 Tax=Streptomyces sp. 5-10 TaxID=878925 RepID=UPI00168AA005|nr:hypothetical protein [Streptomyces sp. 5-10]MBD3004583.1 hypothetical protein [Streptomyces sp. 5-10]